MLEHGEQIIKKKLIRRAKYKALHLHFMDQISPRLDQGDDSAEVHVENIWDILLTPQVNRSQDYTGSLLSWSKNIINQPYLS